MVKSFEEDEMKQAIWGCSGNKSPGPDGFTFKFIRKMWDILKKDIMVIMTEFHQHGRIVKGGNQSFVTLIPKK